MKIIKLSIGIFFALSILSGCSKEEETLTPTDNKSYLSFNILIKDLQKQMEPETPVCPPGSPVFVEIILRLGEVYVAGTHDAPLRLDLNFSSGDINRDGMPDYFTKESGAIELKAGTYSLDYFTVLDAGENVIWIAPVNDHAPGGLDDAVASSLPLNINVGNGTNKFQDVEVICFDERNVNEYGYFFSELNGTQIIEFCLFGNYCDVNGRHAEFMLFKTNVWEYSGNAWEPKGALLHEDLQNEVIITDYEDYAETQSFPLCLTLPDGPGNDEYFIELTQTGLGEEDVKIRSGLISDSDVRSLFNNDGTMEYFHFTEGECNIDDVPILLNDPRDIIGDWEFTYVFGGDAIVSADVIFYPDGTAIHQLYGDPDETILGTWAYYNNTLYYDPDGNEDTLGFDNLSGTFTGNRLSGKFWYDVFPEEWSAVRKD